MSMVKVWYDPFHRVFQLFDKSGNIIEGVGKVTVCDNWEGESNTSKITATVEINVELVNEEPKPVVR